MRQAPWAPRCRSVVHWTTVGLLTACRGDNCTDPEAADPCRVTSISVNPSTLRLPLLASAGVVADVTVGNRQEPSPTAINALPARCETENATILVRWRSDNPLIATAQGVAAMQGEIVAVAPGRATIWATVGGALAGANDSASASVEIVALVPTVRLSANALSLVIGQSGSVTATVVDQDNRDVTSRSSITWESNNEAVATVDRANGVITPVSKGPATITARATVAGATSSATVSLTVADPPARPVAALTLAGPNVVRSSETILLQATAVDANGQVVSDPTLSWQSSAPTKATVARLAADAHKADVEGFLVGVVTVTATAASGKTASMDVTVIPGPVARVVVTPPSSSLRSGQTVQLAAQASDARGNVIAGQPFTWATGAATVATVSNSGLVTAVAAGPTDIFATATGTTVSGLAAITVTPKRVAYAKADQPLAASYSPSPVTSFNSAGGTISITRQGPGNYRVSFPGQRPNAGEVESFIVSGYGLSNGYCKIASWGTGANNDLVADVRCFAFGGSAGDSPFTITMLGDESFGGRFGFGLADQPATAGPYVPAKSFNSSPQPTAPSIQVRRIALGQYAVTFPGNGGGPLDAEAIMVTAYGTGNERCQPGTLLTGEVVIVNCWSGAAGSSVAADSRFVVVLADRGRGGGQRSGFVFIEDSDVIDAGGSLTLPTLIAHNSTTGQVHVRDRGNGRFDVTFDGLGANVGDRFGVQVVDMDENDAGYCSVAGWSVIGPNLVVSVTCWHEEDGEPDPDAFYLFVIQ